MTRDELKKSPWVMVLTDGDTYSGLDGCTLVPTTPEQVEALDAGESVNDVVPRRASMQALIEWAIDQGYFDDKST